jgi:hypothetical protein
MIFPDWDIQCGWPPLGARPGKCLNAFLIFLDWQRATFRLHIVCETRTPCCAAEISGGRVRGGVIASWSSLVPYEREIEFLRDQNDRVLDTEHTFRRNILNTSIP